MILFNDINIILINAINIILIKSMVWWLSLTYYWYHTLENIGGYVGHFSVASPQIILLQQGQGQRL